MMSNDGKYGNTFIIKPEALSQGKGIFLTKSPEDINPNEHCVA
jgi:tubulin polyglutamylase TTLL6/13